MKNSLIPLAILAFAFVAVLPASFAEEYSIALPESDDGIPGTGMFSPGGERFKARWTERRTHFESRREDDIGALFFVGDSITQGWGDDFNGQFDGVKIANRGIGGDTSRGVIYRLERDVLSLDPSGVVILIGTNELGGGATAEVIASDMEVIVSELKKHSTEMPIIINTMTISVAASGCPAGEDVENPAVLQVTDQNQESIPAPVKRSSSVPVMSSTVVTESTSRTCREVRSTSR